MNKRFMLSAAGLATAAMAGAATADITVDWSDVYLVGSEAHVIDLGPISGTLTGINVVMSWTNTAGDSSWASDMLIGVSDGATLISAGGYNLSLGGSSWGALSGSPSTGTYTTYLSGSAAMSGAGNAIVANGWTGSGGVTTSGTMTFYGINAVPAPGALALLGLAGLAGTRRRRA